MHKNVTNRELSKWLAKGNGQISINGGRDVSMTYTYEMGHDNDEVPHFMRVRNWDDTEWYIPTEEYLKEVTK